MPKYIVTLYEEVKQIWYINAADKDEAFDRAEMNDPDEEEYFGNSSYNIEIDDSLDEAEENDLKERSWNVDIDMDVHSFNNPPEKGKK